jgi:uroporphyrinogen III methyltransferase/synthase
VASGVSFVTGHAAASNPQEEDEWKLLAQSSRTIVVYMGVGNLPHIAGMLMSHGRDASTPAAIVSWGTRPQQKTVRASLGTLVSRAEAEGILPPAIAVIGEVAGFGERLRWFDKRPLFGKRVVVTRSTESAERLSKPLRELGAAVAELPAIAIRPSQDRRELDGALRRLGDFGWIVFTSPNGVSIFFSRLRELGFDARALSGCRLACIGTGSAEELSACGITPDIVPETFTSEGLAEAFGAVKTGLNGTEVLLPVSEIARDVVPRALEEMGARPFTVPVYTVETPRYERVKLERIFDPAPDLVTLTSSSTARGLLSLLEEEGLGGLRASLRAASIGPVTTQTARELGIPVAVEAGEHSIPGLVACIREFFETGGEDR